VGSACNLNVTSQLHCNAIVGTPFFYPDELVLLCVRPYFWCRVASPATAPTRGKMVLMISSSSSAMMI
jgi:hypothetical protein